MSFRKILAAIIFSFSMFSVFSAEKKLSGNELSLFTEKKLREAGFRPEREILSKTGSDNFAHNVLVSVAERKNQDSDEGFLETWDEEEKKDILILAFSQEDFSEHTEAITELLKYIRKQKYDFSVHGFFSALKGEEVFARTMQNPERSAVLLVKFDPKKTANLQNGNFKTVTPLWLVERLFSALEKADVDFSFPGNKIALYRIGFLKGEKSLEPFLAAGIPSVFLNLQNEYQFESVRTFVDEYKVSGTAEQDKHYFYIRSPFRFFIGERSLIRLVLFLGTISLMILTSFSFIGKNAEKKIHDFIRSSYLIPIMFLSYLLAFFLGQLVAGKINSNFPLNPIYLLGIKFFTAITVIIILSRLIDLLRIPIIVYSFGNTVLFFALANLFIFSAIDITFFIPFLIEFIIVYIGKAVKKTGFILMVTLAMILPFASYGMMLLQNASEEFLRSFAFSSFLGNLVITEAFLPFMIMFQRILARTNVFAGTKGFPPVKRFLKVYLPIIFGFMIFFFLGVFIAKTVYSKGTRTQESNFRIIDADKTENLSADITKTLFQGVVTNRLTVTSKKDAVRYIVSVDGKGEIPVYNSLYDYVFEESDDDDEKVADIVNFLIPDYPPRRIRIDFASGENINPKITVTAIYKTELEGEFVRESIYMGL